MDDAHVILDFPGADGRPERLRFGAPRHVIAAEALADVRPAIRAAEGVARAGAWVVGFVGYEAAPAFDASHTVRDAAGPAPLAWFGVFDAPAPEPWPAAAVVPQLHWHADTPRARYDDAIRAIRDAIAAGDVYQVNYTIRLRAHCSLDPVAWYDALVARRHGRYHALVQTPAWSVLSASPELFLERCGDRITTRPMKGTAARGRWLQEDLSARERLAGSAKDRAENLMIVDLVRNDFGRVARFGAVSVPGLFDVERYPTLLQMTSTVTAEVRDDVALDDIFAATFPCGSITGAPKFTAMRAIALLEDAPRGLYCGALGVLRPDGSATFNVAIRTIVIDHAAATASYGVGGGITWDSHAHAEYDEALAKAALLHDRVPEFRLLETLRLDDGTYPRFEHHLRRLADSAEYWDFCPTVVERARHALEREADAAAAGTWRIRLLAAADGTVEIQRTALEAADEHCVRDVALAVTAVSATDPLLYHKTTARATYDTRRADHAGIFDVLLYNDEGLVTEFCNGNVVVELAGALLTPPRHCGLLAGTFRADLLERATIREHAITLQDVRRATRLWLINSVREWVPCRLVGG
jgi:para-aminobenzoate synthetase/4-amino-4-deoxychorismate lyase